MKCRLYDGVHLYYERFKGVRTMLSIKEIRAFTGLSQAKFSAALGIPVRTLQKWEIGEASCPSYVVELIEYRVKHDNSIPKVEG